MTIEVKVKLQPFIVPNFVLAEVPPGRKHEGIVGLTKYHLSELDENTLVDLCDLFKEQVLSKARQARP